MYNITNHISLSYVTKLNLTILPFILYVVYTEVCRLPVRGSSMLEWVFLTNYLQRSVQGISSVHFHWGQNFTLGLFCHSIFPYIPTMR